MPIDPALVGKSYPASRAYEVGREKIREFAEAIGDPAQIYRDAAVARQCGHPDVPAPPTFPIVLAMAAAEQVIHDPALGIDYQRVVHGEQRFSYQRPIYAGDHLVATISVTDLRTVAGNDLIGTQTAITTTEGAAVVTASCRLVVRGPDRAS
jgi:acyl dehydratase